MLSLSDVDSVVRPGAAENPAGLAWRRELREAYRDPYLLCRDLGLPASLADQATEEGFPLLAPRPFVARMTPGDPNDPLLLQVFPRPEEATGEPLSRDAVGDLPALKAPGLLQKYHGRALLMAAGDCAVNCRYCFRRHFPYGSLPRGDAMWEPALESLRNDATIREVILSGGDPLLLGDNRLGRLFERLEAISHLKRLRVHTRLPVVIPQRVTDRLCRLLADTALTTVVVLHINHANEIDTHLADAINRLKATGALLLNQSVLLRDVNNSVEALSNLSERLIETGVTPYYLHQLDRVTGVGHFETELGSGVALIEELRKRLPGYAVPRFVQERQGEPYKVLLG